MRLPAVLAAKLALLSALTRPKEFRNDARGIINLGGVLAIAGAIIGAVVAIILIAALMPEYLSAGADVVGVFNNNTTTTGDATADSLLPVFGLLTAFAVLFAIVGLVFLAVKLRKGS